MEQGPPVDERSRETREHGTFALPFRYGIKNISKYDDYRFRHHWHYDPEITVILSGELEYRANNRLYHLSAGEGIFVNSNVLHSGWSENRLDCKYLTINFDPKLIYGFDGSIIETKYVLPLLRNTAFSSCKLSPGHEPDAAILELILSLPDLERSEEGSIYELVLAERLNQFWQLLLRISKNYPTVNEPFLSEKNMARIKEALEYMEENYRQKLTLDEIAASCHMSKSGFCRYFHRLTNQTPFEYLMALRIKKSLPLLLTSGTLSITQIAEASGFSTSSYYAEVFRKCMNCTPTEYIRNQADKD